MIYNRLILVGVVAILALLTIVYGVPFFLAESKPLIIGDGDSIMANPLPLYYLNQNLGGDFETVDIAVSGNLLAYEVRDRDLKGASRSKFPWTRKVVWLIAGTNDLAGSKGGEQAVSQLLGAAESYFRRLQEKGYRPDDCLYTDILPRAGTTNPTFDADRRQFNSQVAARLQGLARVVPSGEDSEFQNPDDLTWFADGIHPTTRGSRKLADDAMQVIQRP